MEQDSSISETTVEDLSNQNLKVSRFNLGERLVLAGTWLIAVGTVLLAVLVGWQTQGQAAAAEQYPNTFSTTIPTQKVESTSVSFDVEDELAVVVDLPELDLKTSFDSIHRVLQVHTVIPSRPRGDVISYTVGSGDSLFGIAKKFNITPETIWWANDTSLENPDAIGPGLSLRIPPIDGVYYQWQEGDTLDGVAGQFEANVEDIVSFIGNKIDLTKPDIDIGQWVMIPGGKGEFKQWVVPTIPRGRAGVNRSASLGPGACDGGYDGAYGTGSFIWPTRNHFLSGNDYWSGHLAIDIAVVSGEPLAASDSGVIVFAGWAYGGYGYMVMIDHGNGYQTLYAHLSGVSVGCGQSVSQGQTIGSAGSTGNSTGPHLHFEVRYNGGWVNPWYYLP